MAPAAWRRIILEVDGADAEPASALLASVTGEGPVLEQSPRLRRVKASIYVPRARSAAAIQAVRARLRHLSRARVLHNAKLKQETVREERWATAWKRWFGPARVAPGLWIVPAWRRAFRAPRGERALMLDPGMAFGTGRHPTTRMALALLGERVRQSDVVIDAGCGSGILGIAAAQRGASVWCFDADPVAVRAARRNFASNKLSPAALIVSDAMPRRFPKASAIVANINESVLEGLAAPFARKLKHSGILISAGITARGRLPLLATYERAGLRFLEERNRGSWYAYVHTRA